MYFKVLFFALALSQYGYCQLVENNDTGSSRIVNGWEAHSREFPWVVGVQGMNDNGNYGTWLCGGALISKNLVLTATHCKGNSNKPFRITLGSLLPGDRQDGDGKTFRYADLYITSADVLIIRLSQSVTFSDTIKAVDLPSSSDDYIRDGVTVFVSGWGGLGENNSGSLSDKLMYTTFKTITNDECYKIYGGLNSNKLCYVNDYSTTCGGDSGSPVVTVNNRVTLVAIHDAGTCKIGIPSVGTRISPYVKWIREEIQRHSS